MNRTLHILALLCLSSIFLSAQNEFGPRLELGVFLGGSLYEGDIAPKRLDQYFKTIHPAVGLLGKLHLNETLAIRGEFNYLTISGEDSHGERMNRGLNFRTRIRELVIAAEFTGFTIPVNDRLTIKGHGFLGGSIVMFNPKTQYNGRWIELQPKGTEGQGLPGYTEKYKLSALALPVGIGFEVAIDDTWKIGFDIAGRHVWTDYLDDVSHQKVVYQDFLDNGQEISAMLSRPNFDPDRDNPNMAYRRGDGANDCVFPFGITITRVIGGRGGSLLGGGTTARRRGAPPPAARPISAFSAG